MAMFWPIVLALLGAAMGSFQALLGERLLRGAGWRGILLGRSRCDHCDAVLSPRDLVPLVSFPLLRGRCRSCHAAIPAQLWHAEIAGAVLGLVAALVVPDPLRALLLSFWLWALLGLVLTDLQAMRLPDPMVICATALGLALLLAGDGTGWPTLPERLTQAALGAAAGGLSFWAIRFGYGLWSGREGMGLGDVKLITALGLVLGIVHLPQTVLIAALATLALVALRATRQGQTLERHRAAPFGAALALAAGLITLYERAILAPAL